jgi:predicted TIM-barrel fold metal-dependent hydrolase
VVELGLPDDVRDKFLYRNASKVYSLDPRPDPAT